jgi:hypothetical protein
MTGRTAAIDSTALAKSNRPRTGLRCSGSRTGATASSRIIAGMLIRNTEPHQKCSNSRPLMIGPSTMPEVIAAVQTAIAVPRCFSSWNMLRTSASVEGIRVAPATPRIARAAMSIVALPE